MARPKVSLLAPGNANGFGYAGSKAGMAAWKGCSTRWFHEIAGAAQNNYYADSHDHDSHYYKHKQTKKKGAERIGVGASACAVYDHHKKVEAGKKTSTVMAIENTSDRALAALISRGETTDSLSISLPSL
jgi:hypothetical protein